jgi:hypothetical protein
MSKQMISKMENPGGNPTLLTLLKYLECVGIDLVEVIGDGSDVVECRNCKFGEVDWPWDSPCDEVNYCRMFARETMPECYCIWGIKKDVSD